MVLEVADDMGLEVKWRKEGRRGEAIQRRRKWHGPAVGAGLTSSCFFFQTLLAWTP